MNRPVPPPSGAPLRRRPRIAVVGSGAAGLGAVWGLHGKADTVLYEAEAQPGGHALTIDVGGAQPVPVDMGFIVYNQLNYPQLDSLFKTLKVPTAPSSMGFSVTAPNEGFAWAWRGKRYPASWWCVATNARRRRLFRDILTFNAKAPSALKAGTIDPAATLDDFLKEAGFSDAFARHYILPLVGAIWSMPLTGARRFPAAKLFAFFESHRLFNIMTPRWRTVRGGSRAYVSRLLEHAAPDVRLKTPVAAIRREADGATLTDGAGNADRFDAVILATHPDRALAGLADPSPAEREALGAIAMDDNRAILHTDPTTMPTARHNWAPWNATVGADEGHLPLTYFMNALQPLATRQPLFVTLNPAREPAGALHETRFRHLQYNHAAVAAQAKVKAMSGAQRTWYCGAWLGFGFHEDAFAAGLEAANGALSATVLTLA